MKKTISNICLILAVLIILDSVGASHWLMLFILAGVIPGTDILISPMDVMTTNAIAITVIVLRIAMGPKFLTAISERLKARSIIKKRTTRHLAS